MKLSFGELTVQASKKNRRKNKAMDEKLFFVGKDEFVS